MGANSELATKLSEFSSEIDVIQREGALRMLLATVHEPGHEGATTPAGRLRLREGLAETPRRAAKAWSHWFGGYDIDPLELLKCFEDGAEGYQDLIVIRDIPFYSHCEHHLAAIIGRATVGYLPSKRIVGLSKINRVVDAYARRLQVQERLTRQIADALWTGLEPIGVGVQVRARHMCMESRGVCQQGHSTLTQAFRGVLFEDAAARAEFIKAAESNVPL